MSNKFQHPQVQYFVEIRLVSRCNLENANICPKFGKCAGVSVTFRSLALAFFRISQARSHFLLARERKKVSAIYRARRERSLFARNPSPQGALCLRGRSHSACSRDCSAPHRSSLFSLSRSRSIVKLACTCQYAQACAPSLAHVAPRQLRRYGNPNWAPAFLSTRAQILCFPPAKVIRTIASTTSHRARTAASSRSVAKLGYRLLTLAR